MQRRLLSSILADAYESAKPNTRNEKPSTDINPSAGSIIAGRWTIYGTEGTDILGEDMTMAIIGQAFERGQVTLYRYHDGRIHSDPPFDSLVLVAVHEGRTFVANGSVSARD